MEIEDLMHKPMTLEDAKSCIPWGWDRHYELWLLYVDRAGERTQRMVMPLYTFTIVLSERREVHYLMAYCHLRKAVRQFNLAGVQYWHLSDLGPLPQFMRTDWWFPQKDWMAGQIPIWRHKPPESVIKHWGRNPVHLRRGRYTTERPRY